MTEYKIQLDDLRCEYDWLCAFFPEKSNLIAVARKELLLREDTRKLEAKMLNTYEMANFLDQDCL